MKNKFPEVIFSNRAETLYECLKKRLFHETSPFMQRYIIVPSPAMKMWLMLQMAKDPELGIAAGINILCFNESIDLILDKHFGQATNKTSQFETALAIELEIRRCAISLENESYEKILSHIGDINTTKGKKRLTHISEQLALLFKKYNLYGEALIQQWLQKKDSNWQADLWFRIFSSNRSFPIKNLAGTLPKLSEQISIHLFGIAHLAPCQLRFFMELGQNHPFYYYFLSPCAMFWEDIKSDSETAGLLNFAQKKKIPFAQTSDLFLYLYDRNPILANFSILGRKTLQELFKHPISYREHYCVTQAIKEVQSYNEKLLPEIELKQSNHSLSLLEALQADFLLMRNGKQEDPITLIENDRSLQIHGATTALREVEILYHSIVQILSQNKDLSPSDILVMAPEIKPYTPFIQTVFKSDESQLSYQLMDLPFATESQIAQAFLQLLSLHEGRWDSATLLAFFSFPAVQRKCKLSSDDLNQFRNWIKQGNIRWGENSEHRHQILLRDGCNIEKIDENDPGTWEWGFEVLLKRWIQVQNDPLLPPLTLESPQAELLGKWMHLMKVLKEDLSPMSNNQELSLNEWADLLRSLCDKWIMADPDISREGKDMNQIHNCIRMFSQLSISEDRFAFTTIEFHLKNRLKSISVTSNESDRNCVKFCSFIPLRGVPSKVIALIGVHEEAFPRKDPQLQLDVLQKNSDTDQSPTEREWDRYLFLETLISARHSLIITYQETSTKKELSSVSPYVQELLSYIDTSYLMGKTLPSQLIHVKHPHFSFDKGNFIENPLLQNFFQKDWKAACAYYRQDNKNLYSWMNNFSVTTKIQPTTDSFNISLNDLASFGRNPFKTYIKKRLGIFLETESRYNIATEDSFSPTLLENALIKRFLIKQTDEQKEKSFFLQRLITTPFKNLYEEKLRLEIEESLQKLEKWNILPKDIFHITLMPTIDKATWISSDHLLLPSFYIQTERGHKVTLIGSLHHLSNQGIIGHTSHNRSEIIKLWPLYLIFCCLINSKSIDAKPNLLMLKNNKKNQPFFNDPTPLLAKYLDHYLNCLNTACPLIPEWTPELLKGDQQSLANKIDASLNGIDRSFYNEEMQWALGKDQKRDSLDWLICWKSTAESLYDPILKAWF